MDDAGMDDRTLRRIIALLVALADLAECAASRSLPVRWFVLCLLRHAEAVALGFIATEAGATLPDLRLEPGAGCGREDALLLALRLRLIACILSGLLEPAAGLHLISTTPGRPAGGPTPHPHPLAIACAGRASSYPDTS